MSTAALTLAIGLSGFFGALVACTMFKWFYSWKGDVTVALKWKDHPQCPQCGCKINTGPLLMMADVEIEK